MFEIFLLFVLVPYVRCPHTLYDLKDSDFNFYIVQDDAATVLFYVPYCEHCKQIQAECEKVPGLLDDDKRTLFYKMDCSKSGIKSCKKENITSYPTIKLYRRHYESRKYKGTNDAQEIASFVNRHVGYMAKELRSMDELDEVLANQKVPLVVGFFITSKLLKAFKDIPESYDENVKFAFFTSKESLMKHELEDNIVLFRPKYLHNNFEESYVIFEANRIHELQDWIRKHKHGIAGHRTLDNYREFRLPLITAYFHMDYERNFKGSHYWRNRVLVVAKKYRHKYNFAVSSSHEFAAELIEVDIREDNMKPVVVARDSHLQKFVMEEEFTTENFENFVLELMNGSLDPYIKSENIPLNNDQPVKIVVAKNFKDYVNSDRDTLIKFYAPWCVHCQRLASKYEMVAEKLSGEEVAVAKMDATANDVPPGFDVEGYPTIYWVPRNAPPIKYHGGHEVNDFIKFVAHHATSELKTFDRRGNMKLQNEL